MISKNLIFLKKSNTEKYYENIVVEDLILKQNYKSIMEIPKLEKIIVNTSSKVLLKDKKYIIPSLIALEFLTSQKIKVTRAKKSIATFKLRKNQLIGGKVTLRRIKMIQFFEKIVNIIMPRLRDFNGIDYKKIEDKKYLNDKSHLNHKGNLNIGLNNFLLFPELENYFEFFDYLVGMNIAIKFKTKTQKEGSIFFSSFQVPLN